MAGTMATVAEIAGVRDDFLVFVLIATFSPFVCGDR